VKNVDTDVAAAPFFVQSTLSCLLCSWFTLSSAHRPLHSFHLRSPQPFTVTRILYLDQTKWVL